MQNVVHAFSSVETNPETRKEQSFVDFEKKLSDFSLPLEIISRLNAFFTPFYMQNVVHEFSSVETGPGTRKSQSIADFDED